MRAAMVITALALSGAASSAVAIVSASSPGDRMSARRPCTPSSITSRTGPVSEPTMQHPAAIASISDQDRTNGTVR
jgi:hypothetical protein